MTTATRTAIALELDCDGSDACYSFAEPLLSQLVLGRYDECSVLDLSPGVGYWLSTRRTARRRASRAEANGYDARPFRREEHVDDMFEINTSLRERQGRPMTAGYRSRPSDTPDVVWTCPRHAVRPFGVFAKGTLVAYAVVYRAGDLALVSQILGHGDHLAAGVMYLLAREVIAAESDEGGFLVYNRADSGTDGLRFYKDRVGFERTDVEWLA